MQSEGLDQKRLAEEIAKHIDIPKSAIDMLCSTGRARQMGNHAALTVFETDRVIAIYSEPDPQRKDDLLQVYRYLFNGADPDMSKYGTIISLFLDPPVI